mgnify:CR=1 FL=1
MVEDNRHNLKIATFPTAAMTLLGKFFILLFMSGRAPNRRQKFGNHKPTTNAGTAAKPQ